MDSQMILSDSLLLAIDELKKKNNISSSTYYIHISPDTSEKELSRLRSTDLQYREGFLNGEYESKIYTVDEFVKTFSPPFGLPMWIDMSLLSYDDSEMHIKLNMSIRFRKNKDLFYKETEHPPIRVL